MQYYLSFSTFATTVAWSVVVLFLCIPAYRRTKEKGFLWLCADAALCLWGQPLPINLPFDQFRFATVESAFVVGNICFIIGIVLIVKKFLRLFEATQPLRPERPE